MPPVLSMTKKGTISHRQATGHPPLAIRHPRSNSPLWRTPKPNLETFKGRCHSEKCRAWWTEYFVMLRGVWGGWNCSDFMDVKFTLWFFFPLLHTTYPTPNPDVDDSCKMFWRPCHMMDLDDRKCSALRSLHFSIWRRPMKVLRIVYILRRSCELEQGCVTKKYIKKTLKVKSLGFW